MNRRLELQTKLEELLGSKNVYYQPPESLKMEYPCIRYSKSNINSMYADDTGYKKTTLYQIIVIDKRPDNAVVERLLNLQYASFDRHYVSNNLHHDVINLYF